MMNKKSHTGEKAHDVIIVGPQDDFQGIDSMDVYATGSTSPHAPDNGGNMWSRHKRSIFKPQPTRSSMRSQFSVRSMRWKWRGIMKAVKTTTPKYEGNKNVGYGLLYLQFLKTAVEVWWRGCTISTCIMRKIVIVEIAIMIFLGFVFTLAGVFKITQHKEDEHTKDFYWAITLVATIVLTLSIMGSIGLFRPNIMVTEMFAVFSFIFGHLIFSIVISWYLFVVLDQYLSHYYEGGKMRKGVPNAIESNIYRDQFLQDYFKLLIVISLVMMSSGVITTKLLIKIRKTQGYVDVYAESAQQ